MTRAWKDTGAVYRVIVTKVFPDGQRIERTQGPYATKGAAKGRASYAEHESRWGNYEIETKVEESTTNWRSIEEDV